MSQSQEMLEAHVARRSEALKKFEYLDPDAVMLNTATLYKLDSLKATSTIIVTGYVPINAERFSINLNGKSSGNIALHFNPRLDRDYVVRNSKYKNHWGEEETSSPKPSRGYIIRRDSYFHITIFCTLNEFQIAIDGEHFCAFAYRQPLADIIGLEVNDQIEDAKVRQTNLSLYPDPKICKSITIPSLLDDQPLKENLGVPVIVDLPKRFDVGSRLLIKGRLKLLPHSFYLNLQKGTMIYPHPVVALHLNPRLCFGRQPACLIMNSWNDGQWDKEERREGEYWAPGRDFLLTIRSEEEIFTVWLNDKLIGEFRHRVKPSIIDTLRIAGDIVLHEIAVSY